MTITPGSKSQASRILMRLLDSPNRWVPMPELSRIGSGKPDGWTASFSRRISDLRAAGYKVEESEERLDGVKLTRYKIVFIATCG